MAKQNALSYSPPINPVLHRPKAAAAMLSASTSWIYGRIRDGSLKSVRLAGRVVRIRHEDLLMFIAGGDGKRL